MPISPFSGTYLPRSLPLEGPNYRVSINKRQPSASKSITKSGDQIRVATANPADCLTVQINPDGLTYARDGHQPTRAYKRADQVALRRPTGDNVVFSKFRNQIMVDRPGWSQDVIFSKTDDGLLIDRAGYANDVAIKKTGNQVSFSHGQSHKDTVVTLTPGLELDPVAFQEEITLAPHGLALLDKWFESEIQPNDVITLTQQGEILEADYLLR